MKKIWFLFASFILFLISCNKESSKSGSSSPLQVSVTDASALMQVSYTSFSSSQILDVQFTESADSIVWWVADSVHSGSMHCDSTIYYPPHYDSLPHYPPTDSVYPPPYIPIDSSHYPRDTTIYFPPPYDTVWHPIDSAAYPRDTTIYLPPPYDSVYHPVDSTRHGSSFQNPASSGYYYTISKSHLALGIKQSGNYVINAAAYHRNKYGSLTLTKVGYVKLSAH